jgi:hypothetical protein
LLQPKGLIQIAKPFTQLTKVDEKLIWGDAQK